MLRSRTLAEDKKAWVIGYANDSSGEVVIHQGHLGFSICMLNFGTKEIKKSIELALRICQGVNSKEGRSETGPSDSHTMRVLERVTGRVWSTTDFIESPKNES